MILNVTIHLFSGCFRMQATAIPDDESAVSEEEHDYVQDGFKQALTAIVDGIAIDETEANKWI